MSYKELSTVSSKSRSNAKSRCNTSSGRESRLASLCQPDPNGMGMPLYGVSRQEAHLRRDMPVISERIETDQAHLIHPLHHPSAHQRPTIWVEGRGAIVKDAQGREYID